MELKQIRCFVAVAESLHFGHAAAKLRIAQPSLTYQIQRLEKELQTSLLRRTKRRVELTDAGRQFLENARDVLARADSAALSARRAGLGEAGRIRVAVGYCMDHLDVSKAVSVFNQRHEAIRVELQTMAVPLQFAALRDDRLDVGFVRPPVTDPSLTYEVLSREPMIVAMRSKHPLARKAGIPLSNLANEPFVLPLQAAVPGLSRPDSESLSGGGVRAKRALRGRSSASRFGNGGGGERRGACPSICPEDEAISAGICRGSAGPSRIRSRCGLAARQQLGEGERISENRA